MLFTKSTNHGIGENQGLRGDIFGSEHPIPNGAPGGFAPRRSPALRLAGGLPGPDRGPNPGGDLFGGAAADPATARSALLGWPAGVSGGAQPLRRRQPK